MGSRTRILPLSALAQRRTGGKTMFDKIWEEHEVAYLGGITSILHVDRLMIADGGPSTVHDLLASGRTIRNPQLVWTVEDLIRCPRRQTAAPTAR